MASGAVVYGFLYQELYFLFSVLIYMDEIWKTSQDFLYLPFVLLLYIVTDNRNTYFKHCR